MPPKLPQSKTPEQIQKEVKFLQECIRVEGLLRPKKKGV